MKKLLGKTKLTSNKKFNFQKRNFSFSKQNWEKATSKLTAESEAIQKPKHSLAKPYYIVDSTLREGEQFSSIEFSTEDRKFLAKFLDKMGVDYIELVNPAASETAKNDCKMISQLGLKAKILTHTRCHMHDVSIALETGVHGVNMYMATSKILREHSHGQGIDSIIKTASQVIDSVKKAGLEVRFSCEDTFRSDNEDILNIYKAVDEMGVDRVGLADTVGIATPFQVYNTVQQVRRILKPTTGIEFHTHNDTGCCIANALMAIEAGATHIDTCILGVGERNGITPLGGFLARMYTIDKEEVLKRYNLPLLRSLEKYVANNAGIHIPFNNYITGTAAFTHKAGVHSKAVISNPSSYEVINPEHFGVERNIQFAHRLTGWNAIAARAKQLALDISEDQIKSATVKIKNLADEQKISLDHVDAILMKIAAGPRVSAKQFSNLANSENPLIKQAAADAMRAIAQYEAALLEEAVSDVKTTETKDQRKYSLIEIKGHLFDKAILNKVFDIVVDSPCEHRVIDLRVPSRNEDHSVAIIKLSADQEKDLQETLKAVEEFVLSHSQTSESSFKLIDNI